jgi:hypothetical protein
MMNDVFQRLEVGRYSPRWVDKEIRVDVRGRAFTIRRHLGDAVTVAKRETPAHAATGAEICTDLDAVLAALAK